MPTVAEIINIAKISQYLASNDVANGSLFGAPLNPQLPLQLYIERKAVEYRYDYEDIAGGSTPSASLILTSNYLLSLCDKYALYALTLINNGGVLPGTGTVTGLWSYPIQGEYTATTDGETHLILSLPSGAHVFQVEKGNTPLAVADFEYNSPYLDLLNGVEMVADETIFFVYVVPL